MTTEAVWIAIAAAIAATNAKSPIPSISSPFGYDLSNDLDFVRLQLRSRLRIERVSYLLFLRVERHNPLTRPPNVAAFKLASLVRRVVNLDFVLRHFIPLLPVWQACQLEQTVNS